jgi:hypothetical protein
MFLGLTRKFRFRAALAVAALYGLCILAPHAALALGTGVAHCLTDNPIAAHVHAAAAAPHAHAGGGAGHHHHHDDGAAPGHADSGMPHEHSGHDGKGNGNCCGLFCISAIALDADTALIAPPTASPALSPLDNARADRAPDRLIRPPIV